MGYRENSWKSNYRNTEERGHTMDFLELVEQFMDMGMDEDAATREAYAVLYPENYDPKDYE